MGESEGLNRPIGRRLKWAPFIRRDLMGTFSIWHWLIVLLVVVVVFGPKKLRNIGTDLGSAVKGFKDGMKDAATDPAPAGQVANQSTDDQTIDVQTKPKG